MSGKVADVYRKELVRDGSLKNNDDSPVPFELWLYWLNTGLDYSLTLK